PFIHELKGDILRDAGNIEASIESYKRALDIIPWAALIRMNMARSQLGMDTPEMTQAALANLQQAVRYEPTTPSLWRLVATAQGRLGHQGLTAVALAEEALLTGEYKTAIQNSERALDLLPQG